MTPNPFLGGEDVVNLGCTGEKRRRIEAVLVRSRKTKNINIRISEYDLTSLKKKAEEEGMPSNPHIECAPQIYY